MPGLSIRNFTLAEGGVFYNGAVPYDATGAVLVEMDADSLAAELDALGVNVALNPDSVNNQFSIWDWQTPYGPIGNVEARLQIPSPYIDETLESYSVVHPSVVYVNKAWNGYKYWMAYTPYPGSDAQKEEPCICASNDFVNWVTTSQNHPLVSDPSGAAYLSDCHLYMLPDKSKLMLMYRDSGVVAGKDQLLLMESTDGVVWTDPVVIWSFSNSAGNPRLLSPSFWHDGDGWNIWAHDDNDTNNIVKKMYRAGDYASIYTSWSALTPTALTMVNPRGETWWHSHFHRLDSGRIVGVIQDNDSAGGRLYLAQTDDGQTLQFKELPYLANCYRSSFHIEPSNASDAEKLVLTVGRQDTTAPAWRFYRVECQKGAKTVTRQRVFARAVQQYSMAPHAAPQILVADNFTGSAGTNLATTTSGAAWTQQDTNNVIYDAGGTKATNENTSNCIATVNLGVSDFAAQVTFDTKPDAGQMYLIFRQVDSSNRWRFGANTSEVYTLQKIVAGNVEASWSIAAADLSFVNGDRIRVECEGYDIAVFVNDRQILHVNDSGFSGATIVGFQASSATGCLWDDLLAWRLS